MLVTDKCLFTIDDKNTYAFDEIDPFNGNRLEGHINRRQGSLYGALFIERVNGRDAKQFVFSTPKMNYPFNRDGEWFFPDYDNINIYHKLDGTNILSYVYQDADGKYYLTFKTRLRPILGNSKFGNFFKLWNEILEKYPQIKDVCFDADKYFSFELYGKKNKVYINYPELLDTRLLFVRKNDGAIMIPDGFSDALPIAEKLMRIDENTDLMKAYLDYEQYLQDNLVVTDDGVTGYEGAVWYLCNDDEIVQMKCKPPHIKDIHFKSDKIPKHSIYITIVNALENKDRNSITVDFVKELLLEEFDVHKVEKAEGRIEKMIAQVLFDKEWQEDVLEHYEKLQAEGLSIENNRGDVMRYFAKAFSKCMASKIYSFLVGK